MPNILKPSQFLEVHTTKAHDLGAYAETADGMEGYRYAKIGATTTAGQLLAAADNVANHLNCAAVTTAAGARQIPVTLGATAATKDQYRGGKMVVNAGTGIGQQFRITGNTAADSSGVIYLAIDGVLTTALSSGDSKVSIYPNKYNGAAPSATVAKRRVGWANRAFASGDYGWLQTKGPVGALCAGSAIALADPVIPAATSGAVEGIGTNAVTDQIVGVAIHAGADTEVRGVDACID